MTIKARGAGLATINRLELICWHLDRYDRLRSSTASRASVVLSAGAILFAGNAILISQLLGASTIRLPFWALGILTVAALASAATVMLSLVRASEVLVTLRNSKAMFGEAGTLPSGFAFNGTDTAARARSFADFQEIMTMQTAREVLEAAQVELWIGIQQHRHRYVRLRLAVRLLRYSATTFMAVLTGAMVASLLVRL